MCNGSGSLYEMSGDIAVYKKSNDIYGCDLTTSTEFPVCNHTAEQTDPFIYGDIVVWYDKRDGGSSTYAYNLTTSTEFPICSSCGPEGISGDIVLYHSNSNGRLYGYNLSDSTSFLITAPDDLWYGWADISGDTVVWLDDGGIYGATLHCPTP